MIAQNDIYLNEAAQTLYEMNSDDMVRQQCLARRDAEYDEAMLLKRMQKVTEEKAALVQENSSLTQQNSSLTQEVKALRKLLAEHGIEA